MGNTRLDAYKYSFFPHTIRIWNILPEQVAIRVAPNEDPDAARFKAALQGQFISGYIYAVPPRGTQERPRLRSTPSVAAVGPVY